ncbi:MAG: hypothetical protein K2X44_09760, partial [Magnetospirillum sp.]|nr:hypothetical protein [Magnetospirillum sp.]
DAVDGRNVMLYAAIWSMGMALRWPGIPRLGPVWAGMALAAALILSRLHVLDPVFWLRDIFIAAALLLLLNAIAALPSAPTPLGGGRWGRRLAGFSYSLYLTHWPVLLLLRQYVLSAPLDPLRVASYGVAFAAAVLAFALAFAFAWGTERQTSRIRRGLMGWRTAVKAPIPTARIPVPPKH